MKLGVIALARATFDVDLAAIRAKEAFEIVVEVADDVIGSPALILEASELANRLPELASADLDALVVLQATFADAQAVAAVAAALTAPLVIWSFPEDRTGERLRLNSLCGANLAAHALRRTGQPMNYLHHAPYDRSAAAALQQALAQVEGAGVPPTDLRAREIPPPSSEERHVAADVASRLSGHRIGVIGDHPVGFDPCRYDPSALGELTGIATDRIELDDLFGAADAVEQETLVTIQKRVGNDLGGVNELDDHGVGQSLRLYGGLRSLADDRGWSAVATRCWPECMTVYGGAACAPQAMLTADGTPGMCEADVYGSLTALLLQEVSGATPFVADLVDVDPSDNTAVLWHCGLAATDLADPTTAPRAIDHTNRGVPLLNEFSLKPGRVTIARLSQAGDRHALVVGGGEMLRRPLPFAGTSGVLQLDEPIDAVLDTIMGIGLEHHYGIVYGEHQGVLRALAERWDIPVIELGVA